MTISSHARIRAISSGTPRVDDSAFIAAGAQVMGDVVIDERASVWYNAVLRADRTYIRIGARSNVQDNVSVHVDRSHPAVIGADVSIGHNAVVHGCVVEDGCLIGMGAVVLSGAIIGAGSLVAAGSVVLEGQIVPPGSLVAGIPAQVRRPLSEGEKKNLIRNAATYLELSAEHAAAGD